VVEVALPAVLTVLPDINKPRIPSLKQILGASKKPVKEISVADLGLEPAAAEPRVQRTELLGTVMNRKHIRFEGETADLVAQVLEVLNKEGLC